MRAQASWGDAVEIVAVAPETGDGVSLPVVPALFPELSRLIASAQGGSTASALPMASNLLAGAADGGAILIFALGSIEGRAEELHAALGRIVPRPLLLESEMRPAVGNCHKAVIDAASLGQPVTVHGVRSWEAEGLQEDST